MTLQKIEFECDIPDGYRFVRYSTPSKGNKYLNNGEVVEATWDYANEWPIVEKIPEQEQPKLKLQYKTQQGYWRDVIDGYEYRIKPKTKTIRFRNYLNKSGLAICVSNDISDKSYFKKWLGDWQGVEIEENE